MESLDEGAADKLDDLFVAPGVKFRYPHDTLASAPTRHFPAGLGGGVDPVWFASGVGERSVSLDRVVFHRMNSEQFARL